MIRLPLLVTGLAIYLGARSLSWRRQRNVIRLRNGRRIKLLSSVALIDRSHGDLLALEYHSELSNPLAEELQLEARSLVQTVGARAEYATCRSALVSVRPRGGRRIEQALQDITFTFLRSDSESEWYPASGVG